MIRIATNSQPVGDLTINPINPSQILSLETMMYKGRSVSSAEELLAMVAK